MSRFRALLAVSLLSAVAHAGGSVEIPRRVEGTLKAGATSAEVEAMLVGASWLYLNPDKEHSTWESKTLAFDATGLVDVTTMYAYGPRSVKLPWHIVRAGNAPAIEINGASYAVAPCKLTPRTTCVVGQLP